MENQQSIKDKIRKLLAMGGKDSGASEEESETAMRMAAMLMARHGIEASALGGEKPSARLGAIKRERFLPFKIYTAQAAGMLYGCQVLLHDAGQSHHSAKGLSFIGRADNIDATEETFAWLIVQINAFYKAAIPDYLKGTERTNWIETFRVACALRVFARAKEAIVELQKPSNNTGSTALVVVDYFKTLEAENAVALREAVPNCKNTKVGGTKSGSGSYAGMMAGDQIKLRREVGGAKQQLRLN